MTAYVSLWLSPTIGCFIRSPLRFFSCYRILNQSVKILPHRALKKKPIPQESVSRSSSVREPLYQAIVGTLRHSARWPVCFLRMKGPHFDHWFDLLMVQFMFSRPRYILDAKLSENNEEKDCTCAEESHWLMSWSYTGTPPLTVNKPPFTPSVLLTAVPGFS